MGYIDEKLMEGEQVVYRTKLHPAVIIFPVLIVGIALVVLLPTVFGPYVALLPAAWLAVELANHGVSQFGVTNKRVLMKRGYLPKRILDTPLEKVERIQVTQSALPWALVDECNPISSQDLRSCAWRRLGIIERYHISLLRGELDRLDGMPQQHPAVGIDRDQVAALHCSQDQVMGATVAGEPGQGRLLTC